MIRPPTGTNSCISRQHSSNVRFGVPCQSNLNNRSYASILKGLKQRKHILQIHANLLTSGLCRNIFLCNSLLNSYVSSGHVGDAQKLFPRVVGKNIFSWTILISGLVRNDRFLEATVAFFEMFNYGIRPNEITISSILPAFGELGSTLVGKSVHCYWIRQNFENNVYVQTALVDMYSKFGCAVSARNTFDKMSERNIISWNAMLSAYSDNGFGEEALQLFSLMRREMVSPDALTIMSLISSSLFISGKISGVHAIAVRLGCDDDLLKTALMDVYINLNYIAEAYSLFLELCKRDIVAWTLMLTGFSRMGNWSTTIQYFNMMMASQDEMVLDSVCLTSIISCCSRWAALQQGRRVHGLAIKTGFEADVFVGSAIIDMYANCSKLNDARSFFEMMERKDDVTCWNALISGNAMHGYGNEAIKLFMKMEISGVTPNGSTLVSVLCACSHARMVDQGLQIFNSMVESLNIVPNHKHYACVVDLLGRAGRLNDAYSMINNNMHLQPSLEVYGALLAACKIHGNIEIGIKISERLFELNPDDAGYYVLLSNIYAFLGNQNGVKMTRLVLRSKNLKKEPGMSLIEINGEVYRFLASEKDHPLYPEISDSLKDMMLRIEAEGHVPDMNCVFQDVEGFVKKDILNHHSEKLAIALGLTRTKTGTMLRVTKNLRICNDCHSTFRFVSKVFGREIIIKDSNFFHVFRDGICSCMDFW